MEMLYGAFILKLFHFANNKINTCLLRYFNKTIGIINFVKHFLTSIADTYRATHAIVLPGYLNIFKFPFMHLMSLLHDRWMCTIIAVCGHLSDPSIR